MASNFSFGLVAISEVNENLGLLAQTIIDFLYYFGCKALQLSMLLDKSLSNKQCRLGWIRRQLKFMGRGIKIVGTISK